MSHHGKIIRSLLAAAIVSLASAGAHAETFPTKPVRILVPYAAGGAVDVLARTIGQSLSKTWGQQPVIENRPGAGGIIASQALTQSPPDGYTLILVASGHPLNQFFYPKLPYDTFKDFTAISEIVASPLAIVVAKNSPVKNLQELLTIAQICVISTTPPKTISSTPPTTLPRRRVSAWFEAAVWKTSMPTPNPAAMIASTEYRASVG